MENTDDIMRGLPVGNQYSRPSGLTASDSGIERLGVPWGHVAAEAVSAAVAGTEAVAIGFGTTVLGGLMMTSPKSASALVGVFVIGMTETIGRSTQAALHVQAAFLYATSDKSLPEIEAAVKQISGTSVSPVGRVVEQATGSKDAGKIAEIYTGQAIGALSPMSGLSIAVGMLGPIAEPIKNTLKGIDSKATEAAKLTSAPVLDSSKILNEKSEKKDDSDWGKNQCEPGHYEPTPKPESEESSSVQTYL